MLRNEEAEKIRLKFKFLYICLPLLIMPHKYGQQGVTILEIVLKYKKP